MSPTVTGLFVGLILGLTFVTQGFGDTLIVAFLGVIGYVIGKVVAGQIDLSPYLSGRAGRSRL